MVKHHLRHATRSQHTMHLAYRPSRVRRVMQDSIRVNHVEALVEKRQVLAIRDHEVAVSAVEIETMARNLDRARREIYPNTPCLVARKLQQVSAHATANLK